MSVPECALRRFTAVMRERSPLTVSENRLLRFATGLVLLAFVAAPLGAQPDRARAVQYFDEAAALCKRDGGKLWGVSLCGPMVFAEPGSQFIATNMAPPSGARPALLGFANAVAQWGDSIWSTLVWQTIPDDPRDRGRLMLHELFHRIQPHLDLPVRDGDTKHLDTVEGRYWLQLEWRALERALSTTGNDRAAAVRDALAFRKLRHELFPAAPENERYQEMNEGLAQYTGTVAAAPDHSAAVHDAIEQLRQAPRYETFVRTYAYPTGAAYGVLLDAFAPGWNRRLSGMEALADVLATKAALSEMPDVVMAASRYGAGELRAAEEQRERERIARVADFMRRFVELPVLVLPRTRQSSSTTSGMTPLGDHGTIVRGFRTTAPWGVFEADVVLRADDYSRYAVPAPSDTAGRLLSGPGWRLQLGDGWVLRSGPRPGDFRLVRDSTPYGGVVSGKLRGPADSRPLLESARSLDRRRP